MAVTGELITLRVLQNLALTLNLVESTKYSLQLDGAFVEKVCEIRPLC